MQRFSLKAAQAAAVLLAGVLASGPALADKPMWQDNGGKAEKHRPVEKREHGNGHAREREHGHARERQTHHMKIGGHFSERQRTYLHEHYAQEFRAGHCPPGLAKKHNGCQAPGQARKWRLGQPLPRDVVFYDLSPTVVAHLGPPPQGYRYVRVATDVLLIAVGTGMVVDAIQDLGR